FAGCALAGSLAALVVLAGAGPEAGPPAPARPPGPRAADLEAAASDAGVASAGWTNSRSTTRAGEPIYAEEHRTRFGGDNGGAWIDPGGEARAIEDSDQHRALPRG